MTVAGAVLAALALQGGAADSLRVTGEPSPYAIFGDRQLVISHLAGPPLATPRVVASGDTLGVIQSLPARLSSRHHETIEQARALYAQRRFADAAAQLAPAYRDEPDNPFVANEYARSLFWIDERREESFAAYRRLIEQLDRLHGTDNRQIAVDAWFGEAYWKVASFYLDREEWERAAVEITRFLSVADRRRSNVALEQVYVYLAEAYVGLGRSQLARWSAQQALAVNPRSGDALRHLYTLGEAARIWSPGHIFACRMASDSLPCLGLYIAFGKGGGGVACLWPNEEHTTALSPCARIGWVHVGQQPAQVEEILGSPWQPAPPRDDGRVGYAYLVFQDTLSQRAAYYIVEYERAGGDTVAYSVQFTGDSTPLPLDFAGLRLGDPAEHVLRQLGAPETRGQFNDDVNDLHGEWWDWNSAGISVEIISGRLYSVRLWRPDRIAPAVIKRAFSRLR